MFEYLTTIPDNFIKWIFSVINSLPLLSEYKIINLCIYILICFIVFDLIHFIKKRRTKNEYDIENENKEDQKEIEKLAKTIANLDDKRVLFVHGGFGVGKTTKTENALKHLKKKYYIFESYNTGFNDNFVLILYKKLLGEKIFGNITKPFYIIKVLFLRANNYLFYVTLILSGIVSQLIKKGNINIFEKDTIVFYIVILVMTLYILPELLTFKKDYSIFARDFYNKLIILLVPEFLIIDDFDRLTFQQQEAIFEFINYFKRNSKGKKIILLGNKSNISKLEDNNLREDACTKFIDQTYRISSLDKIFADIICGNDEIQKKCKISHFDYITLSNLLSGTSELLSRRLIEDHFITYAREREGNINTIYAEWISYHLPQVVDMSEYLNNVDIFERVNYELMDNLYIEHYESYYAGRNERVENVPDKIEISDKYRKCFFTIKNISDTFYSEFNKKMHELEPNGGTFELLLARYYSEYDIKYPYYENYKYFEKTYTTPRKADYIEVFSGIIDDNILRKFLDNTLESSDIKEENEYRLFIRNDDIEFLFEVYFNEEECDTIEYLLRKYRNNVQLAYGEISALINKIKINKVSYSNLSSFLLKELNSQNQKMNSSYNNIPNWQGDLMNYVKKKFSQKRIEYYQYIKSGGLGEILSALLFEKIKSEQYDKDNF